MAISKRASLYEALSGEGNPSFATILKVIHALGLKLQVAKTPHDLSTIYELRTSALLCNLKLQVINEINLNLVEYQLSPTR